MTPPAGDGVRQRERERETHTHTHSTHTQYTHIHVYFQRTGTNVFIAKMNIQEEKITYLRK